MKRYKNFILRAVNLVLILAVLWQYQQVAVVRAAAVAQRQQEISEVESYNAAVLQAQAASEAQEAAEAEAEIGPKDGTYQGSAYGFGDLITVEVTLKDGKITDISVLSANGEDKPYYKQALAVLDKILASQSTQVDTVSGATLTADGMIDAVADALGKAAE